MKPLWSWAAVAVAICACLRSVHADVADIPAARDSTLYEDPNGTLSNGAGQFLFAGTTAVGTIRRGIIGFDIASMVPAGSTITGVTLRLHMSRTNIGGEVIELHQVLSDWGESSSIAFGLEGGGGAAQPGDVTWRHRFFDSEFWTHAGGDFSDALSADQFVLGPEYYSWGSTAAMVADVQSWLDQPTQAYGWLLKGNEDLPMTAKRFDTRENEEPSFQPVLRVEYTAVPEPAAGALLLIAAMHRNGRRIGRKLKKRDFCELPARNGRLVLEQAGHRPNPIIRKREQSHELPAAISR